MKLLHNLSLKRKQTLIIMLTSAAALLLACFGFGAYEIISYRQAMISNVSTLAEIIGNNSTAALDFNNPNDAEETLSALRAEPDIISAALYSRDGSVFATYDRFGRHFTAPSPQSLSHTSGNGSLLLFRPIVRKGDVIGTVFLESDLKGVYVRLRQYVVIALAVLALASFVAWMLSARLQRMVSEPILDLVHTTRKVALEKDFSLRAVKHSGDELGTLVEGFNQMLAQIQQRDSALQSARDTLEQRVEERTRELANSLSLTRATLESTTDGILVADGQGKITGFNENFLKLWKMPRPLAEAGDESQMLLLAMAHLKKPDHFIDRVRQVYGRPESESFDNFEFNDGRVIECYSQPCRLEDKFVGRVWSFRNITERRKAEEALRASEKKLNAITSSAKDAIIMLDNKGQICFWNPAAEEMFGYAHFEAIGHNLEKLVIPERSRLAHLVGLGKEAAGGETGTAGHRLELTALRKNGQEFAIDLALSSVQLEGEWMAIGIVRDITERKRAEAELAAAQKQLVDISRQAGMAEVATSVLHNVGNVLNSVNVTATLAEDQLRKSHVADVGRLASLLKENRPNLAQFLTADARGSKVVDYVGQLHLQLVQEQFALTQELAALRKNVEHIKDIISTQQNYARVSGLVEQVDLAQLLEDAVRMNAAGLARHQVQLVRQYAQATLSTDKHKVLQILVNLISNAKYACDASDSPNKQIALRIEDHTDRVKIIVADNGIGIPPENLNRIFNHGFTTRKTGHGFGLHSGALTAKALGGSLSVHSDGPGKGALFTLDLPRNV